MDFKKQKIKYKMRRTVPIYQNLDQAGRAILFSVIRRKEITLVYIIKN